MPDTIRPGILGVGRFVPEHVLTNHDLEKMVDTSDEWITTRTGIRERRIAPPGMATSDMAIGAAKAAMDMAGVCAEELDVIIAATVTPDMLFPSTACLVQAALGAWRAAAFDLSAGCSGFVYALSVASQYVAAGAAKRVLVMGAETLSRITDYEDRNTCVLFGDGAGAAVIGAKDGNGGILAFDLGADGGGADLLCVPAGGSRKPTTAETLASRGHFIKMEGKQVFRFAIRVVEESVITVLKKAGADVGDIDLFIPHQANVRIIDYAVEKLGIPREKVFVNLDRYGNTSAASIPIALSEAVEQGRVGPGSLVVMVGFGAGLTWGSCALRW